MVSLLFSSVSIFLMHRQSCWDAQGGGCAVGLWDGIQGQFSEEAETSGTGWAKGHRILLAVSLFSGSQNLVEFGLDLQKDCLLS